MKNLKNSVRLVGFLGKDPEVKVFQSGKKKAQFLLATRENYRNAQGEQMSETQWHNVVAWGRNATLAEQYLQKGKQVAIAGRLIHNSYEDKAGIRQFVTEILMNELVMLDRRTASKA